MIQTLIRGGAMAADEARVTPRTSRDPSSTIATGEL
jgi:hypothetical protein